MPPPQQVNTVHAYKVNIIITLHNMFLTFVCIPEQLCRCIYTWFLLHFMNS